MKNMQTEEEIDLLALLRVLWKNAYMLVFWALLCGIVAYAGTFFLITPQYSASAALYVTSSSTAREDATNITTTELSTATRLVETYSALFSSSESLMEEVISLADVDIEAEDLAGQMSISSVNSTEVLEVTVLNPDPVAAAKLADAVAEVIHSRCAEIVDGSAAKVVDYARVPTEIASPSYVKNAAIGVMLGFVLCAAVLILKELMDTTIKTEEDLAQWDIPVLGMVPDFAEAMKNSDGYGYGRGKGDR
jgi:capsular polysaccharide biosynthesis protein